MPIVAKPVQVPTKLLAIRKLRSVGDNRATHSLSAMGIWQHPRFITNRHRDRESWPQLFCSFRKPSGTLPSRCSRRVGWSWILTWNGVISISSQSPRSAFSQLPESSRLCSIPIPHYFPCCSVLPQLWSFVSGGVSSRLCLCIPTVCDRLPSIFRLS